MNITNLASDSTSSDIADYLDEIDAHASFVSAGKVLADLGRRCDAVQKKWEFILDVRLCKELKGVVAIEYPLFVELLCILESSDLGKAEIVSRTLNRLVRITTVFSRVVAGLEYLSSEQDQWEQLQQEFNVAVYELNSLSQGDARSILSDSRRLDPEEIHSLRKSLDGIASFLRNRELFSQGNVTLSQHEKMQRIYQAEINRIRQEIALLKEPRSSKESEDIAIRSLVESRTKLKEQCVDVRKKWSSTQPNKEQAMHAINFVEEHVIRPSALCGCLVTLLNFDPSLKSRELLVSWTRVISIATDLVGLVEDQNLEPAKWEYVGGGLYKALDELGSLRKRLNE